MLTRTRPSITGHGEDDVRAFEASLLAQLQVKAGADGRLKAGLPTRLGARAEV